MKHRIATVPRVHRITRPIDLAAISGGEAPKYPEGVGEGAGHMTRYDDRGMYTWSWGNNVVQYSESLYGTNTTSEDGTVIQGPTHSTTTEIYLP